MSVLATSRHVGSPSLHALRLERGVMAECRPVRAPRVRGYRDINSTDGAGIGAVAALPLAHARKRGEGAHRAEGGREEKNGRGPEERRSTRRRPPPPHPSPPVCATGVRKPVCILRNAFVAAVAPMPLNNLRGGGLPVAVRSVVALVLLLRTRLGHVQCAARPNDWAIQILSPFSFEPLEPEEVEVTIDLSALPVPCSVAIVLNGHRAAGYIREVADAQNSEWTWRPDEQLLRTLDGFNGLEVEARRHTFSQVFSTATLYIVKVLGD